MRKVLAATWPSIMACGLSACNPTTGPMPPSVVLEVTTNPDSTRTIARKINGLLEGRALTYWPSGSLAGISYLHQGKLEGTQRRFYANGRGPGNNATQIASMACPTAFSTPARST